MVVGLDSLIRDMISNQARLPGVAGLSEGIDGIDGIDGTPTDGIDPIWRFTALIIIIRLD